MKLKKLLCLLTSIPFLTASVFGAKIGPSKKTNISVPIRHNAVVPRKSTHDKSKTQHNTNILAGSNCGMFTPAPNDIPPHLAEKSLLDDLTFDVPFSSQFKLGAISRFNIPFEITDDIRLEPLHFHLHSLEELRSMFPDIVFDGILHQFMYSLYGGKFPLAEMSFGYLSMSSPQHNAYNLMLFDDPSKYKTGAEIKGQYISVEFSRILVQPTAYAIRTNFSSGHTSPLISFAFKGKSLSGEWELLDERLNFYPLARPATYAVFYITTDHYFSEFKLEQTGPSNDGRYSFSLAAFEIHGRVKGNAR